MSPRHARSPIPNLRRRLSALVAAVGVVVSGAVAVVTTEVVAAPSAVALDNGLVTAPPMGFNDWNAFGCDVDAALIQQTADYFVSSGLKAAGYTYVNIDDCWMTHTRDAKGRLVPDPVKFPKGITGVADYVHAKGLKLGIYEDAGTETCAGYPGSLGHETVDAKTFASWGVDYLKYDNCNNAGSSTTAQYVARYTAMGDALAATGRPIVYSICEWGVNDPWTWAGDVGNLWRTTGDISDNWGSLKSIIDQNAPLGQYARPGAWNDPDMLEVGNAGMTDTEYRTHFALWAMMDAPLLIGTDLREATPATMAIYTNKDLIALDQDKLGVQAQVIGGSGDVKVFSKPLANGDRAVALYNGSDTARTISTTTAQAGLTRSTAYQLTDLWSKQKTETAGTIAAAVPAHGTTVYRVKAQPNWTPLAPAATVAVVGTGAAGSDLVLSAGHAVPVTTTVTDLGRTALTDVRVTAAAPAGWTVTTADPATARTVKSGAALVTHWHVTAPAGAALGSYALSVTASWTWAGHTTPAVTTLPLSARITVPPPAGTSVLSDRTWLSATNGWGPVERNRSNGETAAGDGGPLSVRGVHYPQGLGTNATSDVVYYLGGACSRLTVKVGIDDEKAPAGDVVFQVFATTAAGESQVADSGVIKGTSAVAALTADLTGATSVRLHVDPDGATTDDHADWLTPKVTCTAA